MSTTWVKRKEKLRVLLNCRVDEEGEGLALDGLLHGQEVIGKTPKTVEIDKLRFSDKDLDVLGPLAAGQFGKVELVTCRLDGCAYVRKRMSKKTAQKTREQCSPQLERDILVSALKSKSNWVPEILCAFQCSEFLDIVLEYAEGGSLWDVVESSPYDGRVAVVDLKWWLPQCVSAISWCHSNGFVHRDIKPHNFVFRPNGRILLIDFGSAATLLPATANGVRLVPKQHCFVPCGTCDYISPEILKAHEEALVALELELSESEQEGDPREKSKRGHSHQTGATSEGGYGKEVDWWSLGAMIYEMAYGVAPFFANDIRQTYARIIAHEKSLKFPQRKDVPEPLADLIARFLKHYDMRLGRRVDSEIMRHPYFQGVDWKSLHLLTAPAGLHLPQFSYNIPMTAPQVPEDTSQSSSDSSKPFAFSAFFQSSVSSNQSSASPSVLMPQATPARRNPHTTPGSSDRSAIASFIGFSWGPTIGAFKPSTATSGTSPQKAVKSFIHQSFVQQIEEKYVNTPSHFVTPMRPSAVSSAQHTGLSTVRVTRIMSSARRPSAQRPLSDREAMKQMVDCVEMSARKRVLESGKRPRILLPPHERSSGGRSSARRRAARDLTRSFSAGAVAYSYASGYATTSAEKTVRKELRFVDCDDSNTFTGRFNESSNRRPGSRNGTSIGASAGANSGTLVTPITQTGLDYATASEDTSLDDMVPPSPSPSPRPGSAMSMISMTRRSATPTFSMTASGMFGAPMLHRTMSEPSLAPGEKSNGNMSGHTGRRRGSMRGASIDWGTDGDVRKAAMMRSLGLGKRESGTVGNSTDSSARRVSEKVREILKNRRISEPVKPKDEEEDEEEEEVGAQETDSPDEVSPSGSGSGSSTDVDVDNMADRHSKLMKDISSLQKRLRDLSELAGSGRQR